MSLEDVIEADLNIEVEKPEIEFPIKLTEFERKMQEALKISIGINTGLCSACMNTGYSYINSGGYSGIEYKLEDKNTVPIKCNHGMPEEEYGF